MMSLSTLIVFDRNDNLEEDTFLKLTFKILCFLKIFYQYKNLFAKESI